MESRITAEPGMTMQAKRRFGLSALLGIIAASTAILSGAGVLSASASAITSAARFPSGTGSVIAGAHAITPGPGSKRDTPACAPDWTIIPSPNQGPAGNELFGIAAVSTTEVWAVGDYDNNNPNINQTLIENWNGSVWTIVPSPNPGTSDDTLSAVAAVSAGDVWAVGDFQAGSGSPSQTLVEHWNGTAWAVVTSPNQGPSFNALNGVGAVSANDIWAAGYYYGSGPNQTLIERLNPCNCTIQFEDVPQSHPFYPFVRCLACLNIINGYPCGGVGEPCNANNDPYFRPSNSVTRGQAAKFVSNAAGFNDSIPLNQQTFTDVLPTTAFWVYAERMNMHGVMRGYPCGGPGEPCPGLYFRPGSDVTRGQTAKIVSLTFFPNC